jgi:bifunctional UDP-N-acetylglucosamine pyrophosphorylase/glucosamine-1-phosphate N-acetyltransferase
MAMASTCALIAAAGRGTRAGLPYPKTLFEVQGQAILLRVIAALAPHADEVVVIASPDGRAPIAHCLAQAGVSARIVIQQTPRGMGDAVLTGAEDIEAESILLAWGDIPFFQPDTVAAMVAAHHAHRNDFTFATAQVASAYTLVARDAAGRVSGVIESREAGLVDPGPGERDIGLFMFRREPVLAKLREDVPNKFGKATGEHGFLYAIGHLASAGLVVEALPVASERDLVSLNSMEDIAAYLAPNEGAR